MKENCDNIRQQIPGLITGTLSAEKTTELQHHISQCPNCSKYLKALQADDEMLGEFVEAMRPTIARLENNIIDSFESRQLNKTICAFPMWGIIIKSRITKMVAAAVIVVGILLPIILLDKTGTPAFGMDEVTTAMAKVEWMHMTYEYIDHNTGFEVIELEIKERWTSVNPKRNITVYSNGKIKFTEYSADEIKAQQYDIETNMLTTRYISAGMNYPYTSIIELILGDIAEWGKKGAKIEYIDSIYEGNPAQIINLEIIDDNGVYFKESIVADIQTHLPLRATVISEKQGKSTTADITFDYPETGPTDIYQAGVPRDAEVRVIGQRITPEFLKTNKPYRAARENLPQQRIVVEVANSNDNHSVVSVIYTNGIKERFEQLRYIRKEGPQDTDEFETILDWANKVMRDELGHYRIQLNDGTTVYCANRDYFNPWTTEKVSLSHYGVGFMPTGLVNRGWPIIRTGTFIENDYAINNNLLCIETTSAPEFTGDSKLVVAAEKTLFYIDPEHDYMCVRIESFRHPVPPPYGNTTVKIPVIDPIDIPLESYLVTEVEQFSQTDTGHWFPSWIRTTDKQSWSDHGSGWEMRETTSNIRLFINTNPEFPDGIFDPESLPKASE